MIGDEEAQTPFELLRDKNLRSEMDGLIEVLDARERKIISHRFGLDGGKPKTLEDVGKDFGVTRSVFGNYRTLPRRSYAAPSARERTLRTKQSKWQPDERETIMKTHGLLATNIALWFTMLSPALGLIIVFLSAWLFGRLSI